MERKRRKKRQRKIKGRNRDRGKMRKQKRLIERRKNESGIDWIIEEDWNGKKGGLR